MKKQDINWGVHARVEKREYKGGPVVETVESEGNLVTTAGLDRIGDLILGEAVVALHDTSVRLGVGDDSTAASVSDTDLTDGGDQYFRVMEASYPQQDDGVMTFRSEFGAGDANFVWECWGLDVDDSETATSNATALSLLNRKVFSFGEKDGGVWTLTVTITLS